MRSLPLLGMLLLTAFPASSSHGDVAEQVRRLTGAPTRVVWCRDMDKAGTDAFAWRNGHVLVGFDTEDTSPERVISSVVSNYHKPMLTADAQRIVFSRFAERRACSIEWNGTGVTDLCAGLAEAVWRDPRTGDDWVFATRDAAGDGEWKNSSGTPLFRFRLDSPDRQEVVWDKTPLTSDSLQISADGHMACGLFPHPKAGSLDLQTGSLHIFTRGCWTAMAPDNSYHMWVFDGSHRNLRLYRADGTQMREVPVNTAPGLGKHEVYHPRWSNHPHILAVTGPYTGGSGDSRIGNGGTAVEIHLGRLATDGSSVEAWVRLTNNDRPDFYPDVWVAKGNSPPSPMNLRPAEQVRPSSNVVAVVEATLVSISKPIVPASIVPYRRAFLAHVFEVRKTISGHCDGKRILVGFWGLLDGKVIPCKFETGSTHTLRLVTDKTWPEARSERVVYDETDESFTMSVYYEASEIAILKDVRK